MLNDTTSGNIQPDVTNPFISKTPASPHKGAVTESTDGLTGLRDGSGRMDIASRSNSEDYSFAKDKDGNKEGTKGRDLDRFVPSRPGSVHQTSSTSTAMPTLAMDGDVSADRSMSMTAGATADPSTSSLSASLGIPNTNRRILSFRSAPPPSSHATSHLDQQRNYLLHATPSASRGTTTTGPGATGSKKRSPPYVPDRVLDAPGFADDYYLNLIDWSCANRVAIGLADVGYIWDAESGSVTALGNTGGDEEQAQVTSVVWSQDGAYLAIGLDDGNVEIWDAEEGKRMRVMGGHSARVPSLSWHGHVLSSGCRDGSIHQHDVRVSKHKVMELQGHTAEVCGLSWRADGQLLASGGNDNVVNCWDGRIGQSVLQTGEGVPKGTAKWTKRNHLAAVKALAWCPWQSSLLATGGGTADLKVHFWSSTTGARTASLCTTSQVTSLLWSPHSKEILSTHGFPDNTVSVWSYPSLEKIYDVPAHDSRVLCSALSPDGTTVATGAGDENLKFWKIWEARSAKKGSDDPESVSGKTKNTVRIR